MTCRASYCWPCPLLFVFYNFLFKIFLCFACFAFRFVFFLASLFCVSARVSHYCLPVLLASKDFQLNKMAKTNPNASLSLSPSPMEATYLLLISSVNAFRYLDFLWLSMPHPHTVTCVFVCRYVCALGQFLCITRQILVFANLLPRLSTTQWGYGMVKWGEVR